MRSTNRAARLAPRGCMPCAACSRAVALRARARVGACARRRPPCGSGPTCGSAASRFISRASWATSTPRWCNSSSIRRRAKCCVPSERGDRRHGDQPRRAFGLAVDGLDPRVILVVDVSHGADVVVGRGDMRSMKDLKGKAVAVESGALGAFVLSRALAKNGMEASDVHVVHLESNEQPSAFEKGEVDGAVTFDPFRAQFLKAGAKMLFDSTQIPGEIVDLVAVRASMLERKPKAIQALLKGWFERDRLPQARARRCRAAHGHSPADERRAVRRGAGGLAHPDAGGEPRDDRR